MGNSKPFSQISLESLQQVSGDEEGSVLRHNMQIETHRNACGGSGGAQQWCHIGKELQENEPTDWRMSLLQGLQPPT